MLINEILSKKVIHINSKPIELMQKAPFIKKSIKKVALIITSKRIKTNPSQSFLTNVTRQSYLILC